MSSSVQISTSELCRSDRDRQKQKDREIERNEGAKTSKIPILRKYLKAESQPVLNLSQSDAQFSAAVSSYFFCPLTSQTL